MKGEGEVWVEPGKDSWASRGCCAPSGEPIQEFDGPEGVAALGEEITV